jgi:hypothetical protein
LSRQEIVASPLACCRKRVRARAPVLHSQAHGKEPGSARICCPAAPTLGPTRPGVGRVIPRGDLECSVSVHGLAFGGRARPPRGAATNAAPPPAERVTPSTGGRHSLAIWLRLRPAARSLRRVNLRRHHCGLNRRGRSSRCGCLRHLSRPGCCRSRPRIPRSSSHPTRCRCQPLPAAPSALP